MCQVSQDVRNWPAEGAPGVPWARCWSRSPDSTALREGSSAGRTGQVCALLPPWGSVCVPASLVLAGDTVLAWLLSTEGDGHPFPGALTPEGLPTLYWEEAVTSHFWELSLASESPWVGVGSQACRPPEPSLPPSSLCLVTEPSRGAPAPSLSCRRHPDFLGGPVHGWCKPVAGARWPQGRCFPGGFASRTARF